MRSIIIASSSTRLLSTLSDILYNAGCEIFRSCKSASEIKQQWTQLDNAVLICGSLKDLPPIYLSKEMPAEWDMVLLLSSEQPFPFYSSNITVLNLPITRLELLQTVSQLCGAASASFGSKATAKKQRPQQEASLIESAKRKIITERAVCESDAHRLLQRYSMNLGITMAEAARRFLNE